MLNNNGQSIKPSGAPKSISDHVIYELFTLGLCFLSDK